MPKVTTEPVTETVDAADTEVVEEKNQFAVDRLPDGRIEATVRGLDEQIDEVIVRVSQQKTAKFILNDVAPKITKLIAKIPDFGE